MASVTNPYFDFHSQLDDNEADLIRKLNTEVIQITGTTVQYLPRTLQKEDILYGEDTISKFSDYHDIAIYINSYDSFEGEGDFFSKFGMSIRDNLTFSVSPEKFLELTGMIKPIEGDLIYFPFNKGLFEITFVEDESPFYPNGAKPLFVVQTKSFEYAKQTFETGIVDVDSINTINDHIFGASDTDIELWSASTVYLDGDLVLPSIDNWTGRYYRAYTGGTSSLTQPVWATISYIEGLADSNQPQLTDGTVLWLDGGAITDADAMESEYESFKDFDETNPFGDL